MKSYYYDSSDVQLISGRKPYPLHENPKRDAWYTAFFIENHLDYFSYPERVDSPEQVRFMVYAKDDERYYPCSDRMFEAIINKNQSAFIKKKYLNACQKVLGLIDEQIEDPHENTHLKSLIIIKYTHETKDEIMIPSRLEKRLLQIYLNRTQIEDPYHLVKTERNRQASNALHSEAFVNALNRIDPSDQIFSDSLKEIKSIVEKLELERLLTLCVENSLWESGTVADYSENDYQTIFKRPITGSGKNVLYVFLGVSDAAGRNVTPSSTKKKILWLADEAGEVIVDLAIIKNLAKLGHKIIVAFKDGPLFNKVDIYDAQHDEALKKGLGNALLIKEKDLSKNELVDILRSDHNIFVLSDGTRENINLLLSSKTFARIFKEVDGIISRGEDQKRRFFNTHFQFTQDIFNISIEQNGAVLISYKPKHPAVIKFSHSDLERKAQEIIGQMHAAKEENKTVVFYSGIIGSIPGKIDIAKKIMTVFIDYLLSQSTMTFIINPSEYYEAGMDADDLMYMWEIVQRSGLIDIWRFQTYSDVGRAFQIMNRKIPPEWVGKDATFSTGCTKEMKIAFEVQKIYPEMQIIGPSKEQFIRRKHYGIGKMYDQIFDRRSGKDRRQYVMPLYSGPERRRD